MTGGPLAVALRLSFIVEQLGGELHGDGESLIARLSPLESAGPDALSFLTHPKYQSRLQVSKAACVVVGQGMVDVARQRGSCIVTADPYVYFARLTQLWKRQVPVTGAARIHPSAVIHPEASVDPAARIGALCVVERGARIGAGTVLKSRVTIGEDCVVGQRCLIHPGAVIGADGFGFAGENGTWVKIEQLGAVRIGDDVEIGANTCIDRGALEDTVIDDGVKLDNLIQIGHNVRVGAHTAMAGCVGVAGSAVIGAHCTIGGGAVVLGHLTVADGVHISAASVVTRSIARPGQYTGFFPIDDNAAWEKNAASVKQLHVLRERLKAIEKKTTT